MKRIFTVAVFVLLLVNLHPVFAGWPMGKKRFLAGSSLSTYFAKDYWDRNGKYQRGTSTFSSYGLSLFGSYGLSRRTDFVFSLPLARQTYNNTSTGGAGDLQLGLSYNLINHKFKNFTSVYGGVIVPLYGQFNEQTLGLGMYGAELKMMNTGNLAVEDKKAFYNVEAGVRQFFATDAPFQINYLASFGYSINKENQIIADVSGTESFSPDKAFFNPFVVAARDYRSTRAALSYGHIFSRRVSVFVGGFYTLNARNTGRGYGTSIQGLFRL